MLVLAFKEPSNSLKYAVFEARHDLDGIVKDFRTFLIMLC